MAGTRSGRDWWWGPTAVSHGCAGSPGFDGTQRLTVDMLYFRLARDETRSRARDLHRRRGWAVLANRRTEWQVGYSLAKGGYAGCGEGIESLRRSVAFRVPWLAGRTNALRDWSQMSLLTVETCRLRRWYRPVSLLIGDAAHTMSPVGGVGITVALQDAAVAANVLVPRLRAGRVRVEDLAAVQRQREWPVRTVQAYQRLVQSWLLRTPRGRATKGRSGLPPGGSARVPHQTGKPPGRRHARRRAEPGYWSIAVRAT